MKEHKTCSNNLNSIKPQNITEYPLPTIKDPLKIPTEESKRTDSKDNNNTPKSPLQNPSFALHEPTNKAIKVHSQFPSIHSHNQSNNAFSFADVSSSSEKRLHLYWHNPGESSLATGVAPLINTFSPPGDMENSFLIPYSPNPAEPTEPNF